MLTEGSWLVTIELLSIWVNGVLVPNTGDEELWMLLWISGCTLWAFADE